MDTDGAARYDRRAVARILRELAGPAPFAQVAPRTHSRIEYRATALRFEPGSHLTLSQRLYLERFMRPCPPEQVTSATHRVSWLDEEGVANTGHFHSDGLGPVVPIAARTAFLALWNGLRADAGFAERAGRLDGAARSVLAGTTTDHEPLEVFRVGLEAAARALTQHALLAHRVGHRDPARFALALRGSGIFVAVATRWFWELQASTHRRGMAPVELTADLDGRLRYTPGTLATLRVMKEATIAEAHAVMHRARTEEGLGTEAAIARYHDELDLISRQYALLAPGEQPACPAAASTLLPLVVERFVAAFADAVQRCELVPLAAAGEESDGAPESVFAVPDMNCKHCVRTITAVLTAMDIAVHDVDLDRKIVRAEFRSTRNRDRAFEALRDSGYNPTPHAGAVASVGGEGRG
ncbi:heavy-metal-associated domain-containing protein [Nocardia sp. NPDC057353]|uniref:heavy-metal-associated domain-containing protein n=1 Tax=Nocardia sp. NPDC057353 TaxID=3346104 RepID=UPI00363ACF41